MEGTVGTGSKGDIAVDDLTVLDGICQNILKQSKYNKEICFLTCVEATKSILEVLRLLQVSNERRRSAENWNYVLNKSPFSCQNLGLNFHL